MMYVMGGMLPRVMVVAELIAGLAIFSWGVRNYSDGWVTALVYFAVGTMVLVDAQVRARDSFKSRETALLLGAVLIFISSLVRALFLDFQSNDYNLFFSGWYDTISNNGRWAALANGIGGYNSPYSYLLVLATYLPIPKLYAVKLFPVLFDYLAGYFAFKIVRLKYPTGMLPHVAFFAVIFSPSVVIISSMWGQFDVIFTSFLLGSLYFMAKMSGEVAGSRSHKLAGAAALVLFSIALSVKLQAIFFVLPLVFLYVSRQLPWRYYLLVPLVFVLIVLPNSLLGRPFLSLLTSGGKMLERNVYPNLNATAASVYRLFPALPNKPFFELAIILVFAVVLSFSVFVSYRRLSFSRDAIVRAALLSLLAVPYLLPAVHERHFFPAEVVAIIFAFYFPRYWFVPIIMITVSLMLAFQHLFGAQPVFGKHYVSLALGVVALLLVRDFILSSLRSGESVRAGHIS